MDLSKILNIKGVNIEEEIKSAITNVKKQLNNLDTERTCKIYARFLYRELKLRHIWTSEVNKRFRK